MSAPPAIEPVRKPPAAAATEVLAVGVWQGAGGKQRELREIDAALRGAVQRELERRDFQGRSGESVELPTLGLLPARRVLVAGLGPRRGAGPATVRRFAAEAARAAAEAESLALSLPAGRTSPGDLRAAAEGIGLGAYRFLRYRTGPRRPRCALARAEILTPGPAGRRERAAVATGRAVAAAVAAARDAVNEPANVLTPAELARRACALAEHADFSVEVLDERQLAAGGFALHRAVGAGSANPPRLVHVRYAPRGARRRVAAIGKAITFDSGGLCIKPPQGMEQMKSDMAGAAAVLGLMHALAAVRPRIEVHGFLAAAENMPGGTAYRPGDILTSLEGRTVEIVNTDAEGRLVLADALAYARRFEPAFIIDLATLTGACMVALGKSCSAYYTDDEALARRFQRACREAGESFWRMPLLPELRAQLDSDVADIKHVGDRWGGSITGALFLKEFAGDTPWIHCDIAGPAFADKPSGIYPKGGTGHGVLTLLRLIESSA